MIQDQDKQPHWILRAKIERALLNKNFSYALELLEYGESLARARLPGRERRTLLRTAVEEVSRSEPGSSLREQGLLCIAYILQLKVDPYQQSYDGDNALHRAVNASGSEVDVLELLLGAGVDPHRPNAFGKSVYDGSATPRQLKVLQQHAGPARPAESNPTVEELTKRLQQLSTKLEQTVSGVDRDAVDQFERHLKLSLPRALREFYERIGNGAGVINASWPYWIYDWNDLQRAMSGQHTSHLELRKALMPNDKYIVEIPSDHFVIGGCDNQTQFYLTVRCDGDEDAPVEMFYVDFETTGAPYNDDDYDGLFPLRMERFNPSFWSIFRDALTRKELEVERSFGDDPDFTLLEQESHPAEAAIEAAATPPGRSPHRPTLTAGVLLSIIGLSSVGILWFGVDNWPPSTLRGADFLAAMAASFSLAFGLSLAGCSFVPSAVVQLKPRPGHTQSYREIPWYGWLTIIMGFCIGLVLLYWGP